MWSRFRLIRRPLALVLVLTLLLPAPFVAASQPPAKPSIVSPFEESVAPGDVHMELDTFVDADGDAHVATDWEIRTGDGATVAWAAYGSQVLVHAHLGDGSFQGPLAGKTSLEFGSSYLFRVRVQDSSGAWSEWAEQWFTTAFREATVARRVTGILARPVPDWQSDGGAGIMLPDGARLAAEAPDATVLLTLAGTADGLVAMMGASLPQAQALRLRIQAPDNGPLHLPGSQLRLVSATAERVMIYLPELALAPGQSEVLWVAETGATYYNLPDRTASARAQLARDVPLPWAVPPGYRLTAVSAGFQLPTSLAFVPDPGTDPAAPRFYVTELYGGIKVVTNDGRVFTFARDLLNFQPDEHFVGTGELGVIGICLPPGGRDVYVTTIFQAADGVLRNRVIRLRSDDGLTATGLDEILVVGKGEGNARSSHQVQQCSFGPDGKLYVFMADGPNPAAAQNFGSFNGKVLRLNPDGSAPTDNPFYDPDKPAAPISYLYTRGHRNAFGMAWQPSTGQLYLSENGPNTDRLVRIAPGRNYGWDGTDESMVTEALYVWPQPRWSPVGLTFIEGPQAAAFPADRHGHLFVGAAGPVYAEGPQPRGKAIQEFVLDPDGRITRQPTIFAHYIGQGYGSVADLKLQADGLYFTDLYRDDGQGGPVAPGGTVWRIHYAGAASFTASASTGPGPLTVQFSDTSTLHSPVAWTWDFGDGSSSAEPSPTHTFTQPGRYAVSLTVTGADGTSAETLMLVTVTDGTGQTPEATSSTVPVPAATAPPIIFVPRTGVSLGGGFKYYWEHHGGLTRFGYPISNELREVSPTDGVVRTVQYFERARFEYHPEHQGTPYETELGLLGREVTAGRMGETAFQPVADAGDGSWIPETGHTLREPFRSFWEQTGGVTIYGLPISEAFQEGVRPDGSPIIAQYFERARLEHQPELRQPVQVEALGTSLFVRRPPPRLPA